MAPTTVAKPPDLLPFLIELLRPMGFCEYEEPESSLGACDGGQPCMHTATIHDLESDLNLCGKHFELKPISLNPLKGEPSWQQQSTNPL